MDFMTHIGQAFSNLLTAKLRSFLAVLGILVGTGSVVALIMCGELATSHALAQFKSLGTNLLSVSFENKSQADAGSSIVQSEFTIADLPALYRSTPQVTLIAPYIQSYQSIFAKGINTSAEIFGADQNFSVVLHLSVARGRMINSVDKQSAFCDIGSALAKKIRQHGVDPLGTLLVIGKSVYTIIGVLKSWEPNYFLYADIDHSVIIPLQSAYYLGENTSIKNVLFRLQKKPDIGLATRRITQTLTSILPDKKVYSRNPGQIIGIIHKQQMTFTLMLASIAAISLVVGGIGVMNIMLVSVVQRRRAIGVRMAIGAKRVDILTMFLIEAIILTLFGGAMGALIGALISYVIADVNQWTFVLYWQPLALGFGVSVLVGILSGWYPAFRASRLDPIQILSS